MTEGPPAVPVPRTRVRWRAVAGLFTALGLLLYLPALRSYFSSDDFLHLGRVIEGGLPFVPEGRTGGFLRPLIGLSFWLEYHLWGLRPFPFHLANVLSHVANSLLVVALARQLQRADGPKRNFFAVASGLLFLAMTCHAEPVSWISGRTDVFATFFMLVGLVWAAHGLETDRAGYFAGSLGAFVLALAAKESALAFPFVLVLVVVQVRLRDRMHLTPAIRGWLVANALVLVAYFVCRWAIIGAFIGGYGAQGHLRMSRDILAQATARFAWRSMFPPLPDAMAGWMAERATIFGLLWLVLLLLFLALLVHRAWRRKRAGMALFLFCAFWAALLPVINVRIQWTNPEGERFLYFASVFAAIAVAYALSGISRKEMRVVAMVAVLLLQVSWLVAAVGNWHEAGEIAHRIVNGIQGHHPKGPVILVNKPDSLDGALVLRTGLPEALRYFGAHPLPETDVAVLYAVTVFQHDHHFQLERLDGVYLLAASDPTSVLAEEDRGDHIETLATDHRVATFRFRTPLHDESLFYYDSSGISVMTP